MQTAHHPDSLGVAGDPAAHAPGVVPAAVDQTLDDDHEPVNEAPREARNWRLSTYSPVQPGPGTDTTAGAIPEAHAGYGSPDPRDVWASSGAHAGMTGAPDDSLRDPEDIRSDVEPVIEDPQYPIDRPRGGSIGTDETRPSVMPRWQYFRPFDKSAQYEPSSVDKIPQQSPVASRPLDYSSDLPDALPSPGGSGSTRADGVGVDPNTVRYLPQPWDSTAVTPAQTTSYEASARARGWRL